MKGEVLLKALMDTIEADKGGFEYIKPMIDAESALKLYIAGLESAIGFIAGVVEGAVELITKEE